MGDGTDTATAPRKPWRVGAGFLLLFVLYQSAEGIGQRLLHDTGAQAALMTLALLAAWPVARWLGFRGMDAYALAARGRDLRWLALLPLAVLAKAAALALGLAAGVYAEDAGSTPVALAGAAALLPLLLVSTFVPSLAEDILTRGFPYRAAHLHWRSGAAFVLASSTLYVANHIFRLHLGPVEWLLLVVFGATYATALWRTRTLWAALGLHWGWNLANEALAATLPTTTVHADAGRCLSMAVHVVLLAIVFALTRRPREESHR